MANEIVARNGIIIENNSQITGSLNINGSLIVNGVGINAASPKSYYQNIQVLNNTSAFSGGGSSNIVQPFVLPYDISIGYLRFPVTISFPQTSYASTANTAVSMNQAFTWYANLYSQGTGASSKSIIQFAQATAGMTYNVVGSIGAASNNQTVFQNFTFPIETATTNFASTVSSNLSNQSIVSTNLTAFSGARFMDLAFNTSLAAGNYFIAFQKSSAVTTNLAALSNITANTPHMVQTQIATNINIWGNTTAQSNGIGLFQGVWTTNANGRTTNAINQTAISSQASQVLVPFQLIRQA